MTKAYDAPRGASNSPEYRAWRQMLSRCRDRSNRAYGARGIAVCERWNASFAAFLEDLGRRPRNDFSLDRINTNGNYEPGNVRWASRLEQARNRRIPQRSNNSTALRINVNVRLPRATVHCMREHCAQHDVKIQRFVREAVEEKLKRNGRKGGAR